MDDPGRNLVEPWGRRCSSLEEVNGGGVLEWKPREVSRAPSVLVRNASFRSLCAPWGLPGWLGTQGVASLSLGPVGEQHSFQQHPPHPHVCKNNNDSR